MEDEERPRYRLDPAAPIPVLAENGERFDFADEDEAAWHMIEEIRSFGYGGYDHEPLLAFVRSGEADGVLLYAFLEWAVVADIEALAHFPAEIVANDNALNFIPVSRELLYLMVDAMPFSRFSGRPYPSYLQELMYPVSDVAERLGGWNRKQFFAEAFGLPRDELRAWVRATGARIAKP